MMRRATLLTLCTLLFPAVAGAQHETHGTPPDRIGSASVKFDNSCAPAVRDDFNKAVALLHSFWYPEATKMFESIAQKDSGCAVAYWGVAMSQWGNPFAGIRAAKVIEAGTPSVAKARATGTPTPRERALIEAVAILYSSAEPTTQRDRVVQLRGGHAAGRQRAPEGYRAAHFLCAGGHAICCAHRQDLRQAAAGGGDSRAAVQADADASWPRALHHPRVRRAPAGGKGARRRAALRVAGAGCAACAPHAVAHVHPRRLVEGIDRDQSALGGSGAQEQWSRRRAPRARLSGLRVPADRPGQGRKDGPR